MLIDVLGEGFGAGVRLADTVPPNMIAVPILPTIRSVVVGARGYFVGRKRPVVPADLMRHQCIRARMGTGKLYRWEFEKHGQVAPIDAPGSVRLDESGLMLEAALAGAGLVYIGQPSGLARLINYNRVERPVALRYRPPQYSELRPFTPTRLSSAIVTS